MFEFVKFPRLSTERMVLREITEDDVEAVYQIRSDYEVTKYNTGHPLTSYLEAKVLINNIASDYEQQASIRWGLALKVSDALVGMCGFNYWDRINKRASVGYDLARTYWGRGLMPEALHRILQFGFEEMELNRIEADCTSLNKASERVLEKVGFKHEGLQREQYFEDGQFYDLLLFSLLRSEFKP
jgi:[ribosomal protein S5]-alanine N-acetyltransferase